jgi:hypothetical protein
MVTLYGAFIPSGFLTLGNVVLNVDSNVKKIEGLLGWWVLEVEMRPYPTITSIISVKFQQMVEYRGIK